VNAKRLHERWRASLESKIEAARKLLRKHRALSRAEVHDLRVALRRAQLLANLGSKTLGKTKAKQCRHAMRSLLKTLHLLRDCDVAMDWLESAKASEALLREFTRKRTRLWTVAKRQLKAVNLGGIKIPHGEKADAKKLVRKLEKQVEDVSGKCREAVRRAPEAPLSELHALRRIVRRWRYLRELQLAPRQIRRDRRLKTLIEVQEALGALQNTEVILDQLSSGRRTKELLALRATLRAACSHHHREALREVLRLAQL